MYKHAFFSNKRMKSLAASALAAVMVFSMAGCSKSDSGKGSSHAGKKHQTTKKESTLPTDVSDIETTIPADASGEDYDATVEKIIRAVGDIWGSKEATSEQKEDLKNGAVSDYPNGVYVTFDEKDSQEIFTPKKSDDFILEVEDDGFSRSTLQEIFFFYKTEDSLTYTQAYVCRLSSEAAADDFFKYMKKNSGMTEEKFNDLSEVVGGFKEDENMQVWLATNPDKRIAMSGNHIEKRGNYVICSHIDGIYNETLLNDYLAMCRESGFYDMEKLLDGDS